MNMFDLFLAIFYMCDAKQGWTITSSLSDFICKTQWFEPQNYIKGFGELLSRGFYLEAGP